ncbi:hypothetical protein [Saccharopolyspora sp. SCSIO 74807]|uniref:glycine-rich domain-containing protein n=1 Tax=Saccharopolyspora sp. SCSIO 74807 TaxID=3118084 RepID=UPI0030CA942B
MSATLERASSRTLISDDLFNTLSNRIARENACDFEYAERILEQALAFLITTARYPSRRLSPSSKVDVGWHTFILYTKEYAAFCHRYAGRFVHHVPNDYPNAVGEPGESATVSRTATLDAIEAAGYVADPELWEIVAGKCKPGDTENGCCAASGKDGNENTENQTPPR